MNLYRVKGNRTKLLWPPSLPSASQVRGEEGYVVDLDAPLEREWCAGQMHQLEPAPDAKAPTPITMPAALNAIARWTPPAPEAVPPPTVQAEDELEVTPAQRTPRKAVRA